MIRTVPTRVPPFRRPMPSLNSGVHPNRRLGEIVQAALSTASLAPVDPAGHAAGPLRWFEDGSAPPFRLFGETCNWPNPARGSFNAQGGVRSWQFLAYRTAVGAKENLCLWEHAADLRPRRTFHSAGAGSLGWMQNQATGTCCCRRITKTHLQEAGRHGPINPIVDNFHTLNLVCCLYLRHLYPDLVYNETCET